jgi:hypothetical protein
MYRKGYTIGPCVKWSNVVEIWLDNCKMRMAKMPRTKQWIRNVKTVSTFPPKGLFTKDADTIARVMGSKHVSPKRLGSAIRMVQFFLNRAGAHLSTARKRELEWAKALLQARRKAAHEK